ncbi:MAG: hypothetical protein JSU07_08135 [Bacteroidetes bacterium]|nr:hypothetical protein [Bacteroidota bacterium]
MVPKNRWFLFVLFLLYGSCVLGQVFNAYQKKKYKLLSDTLVLDSLSILPGSINYTTYPLFDSLSQPIIDYRLHALIFKKKPDSILISYTRFPYNFEKAYYRLNPNSLYSDLSKPNNPYLINFNDKRYQQSKIIEPDGLTKNGNISRGISFGNTQDVVLNSNLNLQVSGKLTPDINILLAATDNNIPFQADGTTAQLQEFDKVYVQLNNASTKLIVGDFQLSKPTSGYFMTFYKRGQGGYIENIYKDNSLKNNPLTFKTQFSAAISKGKFCRQYFYATENNQGPYRLRGANNEPFIIILSGTERIYIDGVPLKRGQENDYIIDYNTGEITFTARQQITKDKRITAEFQYAERNYSRSMIYFSEEIKSKKATYFFNAFSEQDNKNRPLQQTLTQDQKNILYNIGDTLSKAISSGVQQVAFNNTDAFYWKKDTIVGSVTYYPIYVYSTNADSAKYRVTFSNVGTNNGNYIQVNASANGKVYSWVAPQGGVPQGNFEPIIQLVTPKQTQMFTTGVNYSLTEQHAIGIEGAYTKNDVNTYSPYNKNNVYGNGLKVFSKNEKNLRSDTLGGILKFIYNANAELITKQFNQVERFRSTEFDRDWNRPFNSPIYNDQQISNAEIGLVHRNGNGLTYNANYFNEGTNYQGLRHNVFAKRYRKYDGMQYTGSLLNTIDNNANQSTEFYRHKTLLFKQINKLKFSFSDEFEHNIFKNKLTDLLAPRAYQFWEYETAISSIDSSKNKFKIFYKERYDKLNYANQLRDSTYAQNIGIQSTFNSIKNNPISLYVTYRKLELRNVVGNSLKPDNTFLNRLEYAPRFFKNLIIMSAFYETGYGLQNKQEYYYLEVPPGQGQYAWIDYNNDGIKQLNEFEIAQFPDQARYIRIYTPTNQYTKVLQNQVSLSATIRPSILVKKNKTLLQKFARLWVFQGVYRKDNKTADNGDVNNYNPFYIPLDTLVLSQNNNIRGSVFLNQTSAIFGADYTTINNRSKQLQVNGIETRALNSHEIKWRFNFYKAWSINSDNIYSLKENKSQFFVQRNYIIQGYETEQKIIYQPNTTFRISGVYKIGIKQNIYEGGLQKANINTYGLEIKYNQTEKGSLNAKLDYIKITYNGMPNTPVSYEMLNALTVGQNFTWELSYQRNLNSNIQISITYNGRKMPGSNVINLGGAQIRAFF